MFDLTTILTLLAPAVLAFVACRVVLRVVVRQEASRHRASTPAVEPAQIMLDPSAGTTQIVLDPASAAFAPDHVRERHVA